MSSGDEAVWYHARAGPVPVFPTLRDQRGAIQCHNVGTQLRYGRRSTRNHLNARLLLSGAPVSDTVVTDQC